MIPAITRAYPGEDQQIALTRMRALEHAWPDRTEDLGSDDLSILRELFGSTFLTSDYMLDELHCIEDVV